jgi:hypothetical protein
LSDASTLAQVSSHAVAGGILSDLQGGKFGHGFFSAGFTKWAGKAWTIENSSDIIANSLKQAMIGGTASKITGGKFANGAFTAALQYIVNEASQQLERKWAVKAAEQNVKDTFRANTIIGNKYDQKSVGSYVYQIEGEEGYRYDRNASPRAALGFDVDSAPLASPQNGPNRDGFLWFKGRQATDWFIAVSPNDNISLHQTFHRAGQLNIQSVYRWNPQNNTTLHYSFSGADKSWNCSVYSGGGNC